MNTIIWLKVEKEDENLFATARVTIGDDDRTIRFEIDKKSGLGLSKVLLDNPFNERYGSNYIYKYAGYSVDKASERYDHYVEICLSKMCKKVKLKCSQNFCQNLKWLTEIETKDDLSELST